MADQCILCDKDLHSSAVSTITPKGLQSLLSASAARSDGLAEKLKNTSPLIVHAECRKRYTRPTSITADKRKTEEHATCNSGKKAKLRSSQPEFDIKHDCMLCGKIITAVDTKQPVHRRKPSTEVGTLELSIEQCAKERNDAWGASVQDRLTNVTDYCAAEAKYHRDCYQRFLTGKTLETEKSKSLGGRPETPYKSVAFDKLCQFLDEIDACQYSLSELSDRMNTFLDGEEGYTLKHLKSKLSKHYGSNITITSIKCTSNVVCFKDVAHKILQDTWYTEKASNDTTERIRIVEMAASIIRDDIRLTQYDCDTYPTPTLVEDASDLIPDSLKCFLEGVLKPKCRPVVNRRSSAIAQAILSACRPRSFLSPLLLALAVYIHRKYASRELIDILHSLDFCVSYQEVQIYEYVILSSKEPSYDLNGFVQFVFDNADFNVHTLDGHNTFHSMGGIACVTPAGTTSDNTPVTRTLNIPAAEIVGSFGKVPIRSYTKPPIPGLKSITVEDLSSSTVEPQSLNLAKSLDTLWLAGIVTEVSPRPSWSGYMEVAMSDGSYDKSRIVRSLLRFIEGNWLGGLASLRSESKFYHSLIWILRNPVRFIPPCTLPKGNVKNMTSLPVK